MSGASKEGRGMPLMFVHSSVNSAGLSFKAYRVLGQLHQMSEKYDHAFPSVETLAEAIGANRNTVKEALAELVAAGFIVRTSRPGTSSLYRPVKVSERSGADTQTRPEKRAGLKSGPAQKTGHGIARKTGQGVARKTGHKGNLFKVMEEGAPESTVLGKPEGEVAGGKVSKPSPAAETAEAGISEANAVPLPDSAPAEIRELWTEWQLYRTGRATTGPKSQRLPWTAQAARMSARQIENAMDVHPAPVVADRIRAAIAGNWQGLNLDKLEARPASRPQQRGSQKPAYLSGSIVPPELRRFNIRPGRY